MTPLFQLETLKVFLQMDVRNLYVELQDRSLKNQTLTELNQVIDWLQNHVEVDSVLITSKHKELGHGWNREEWSTMNSVGVEQSIETLRQIVFKLINLPQTVVADLGRGAEGASLELSLGADIRIMEEGGRLVFNHLQQGMVPACGGIGILSALVGYAQAKNWVQTSLPVPNHSLLSTGFVQEVYNFQDGYTDTLLDAITHQSPVGRIQAKRAFAEMMKETIARTQKVETKFSWAGYATGDFFKFLKEKSHKVFTSAREWKESINGEFKEPVV